MREAFPVCVLIPPPPMPLQEYPSACTRAHTHTHLPTYLWVFVTFLLSLQQFVIKLSHSLCGIKIIAIPVTLWVQRGHRCDLILSLRGQVVGMNWGEEGRQ